MLKQTAVALGLSIVLTGCASGPKSICLPDQKVDIPESSVPAKSSEDRKMIVLPVDMSFKDSAKDRIQSVMRNKLESQIVATGTHLVDRKLADQLTGEIKLAEQSGRYSTKGVPIADLAVLTEVTSSDRSASFTQASTYKNKKGETVFVPAKCTYKVEVKAIAKVVALPDMTLVKRFELKGDEALTTETKRSDCPLSEAGYQGLASKAAEEAVEYSPKLKSLLAATAPVMELRQCEAGSMVKIGVGSNRNVKPNTSVAFSKIMKNDDGELETFAVGKGTVVNIPEHGIKKNYSWVGIDEEVALKIQKGDAARIVPKACENAFDLECRVKNL